jgi:hypothetical protein
MADRLALLIDGENIAAKYFPEIARHCLKIGELRTALVYADFSEDRRAAGSMCAAISASSRSSNCRAARARIRPTLL